MDICRRSKNLLNPSLYKDVSGKLIQVMYPIEVPDDQYILRMMIKSPKTGGKLIIPSELEWLKSTIETVDVLQGPMFRAHPFAYVTVRSGVVRSTTDDEWHVDGFSMRVPHYPEQNYIWSDCYPTEYLDQQFVIPEDFDPMKHNIHQYFEDNADPDKIRTMKEKHIAFIDPYVVHRRPKVPEHTKRCFFRISFVPIEIEDDTCTRNPLMEPVHYGREDIRKTLTRYK